MLTEFKGVLPGEYIACWRMKFLHNSYVEYVELMVHLEDWKSGDFLLVPVRRVESEEMRRLAADVINLPHTSAFFLLLACHPYVVAVVALF